MWEWVNPPASRKEAGGEKTRREKAFLVNQLESAQRPKWPSGQLNGIVAKVAAAGETEAGDIDPGTIPDRVAT